MRRRRRSGFARQRVAYGQRIKKPEWVDPFPGILGTKIEKMILAELVFRRIPFYFQYNVVDIPWIKGVENWRVDFYVPAGKVIIEANGFYWHTLTKEKIASDAFRYANLEAAGYKVVAWYDYEIETRLWELFEEVPELARPLAYGPPLSLENANDDLKAIRLMNARRMGRVGVTTRKTRRVRRRHAR